MRLLLFSSKTSSPMSLQYGLIISTTCASRLGFSKRVKTNEWTHHDGLFVFILENLEHLKYSSFPVVDLLVICDYVITLSFFVSITSNPE
jgi:hypothetical protein